MTENNGAPSALATVVQLIIWSVVVGVVLSALGITPFNLFERLGLIVRNISHLGLDAVHWGLQYLLLGAVIVVPVWLLMRVLRGRGQR
jgi:ABC-type enterochelin transport system permease subunit